MTKAQKDGLMEEFIPDVEEIVRELNDGSIPEEDLMQEGYIGLIEGIDSLSDNPDEWSGLSMEDQVHESIRRAVTAALEEQAALIKKDDQVIVQVEMLSASIDKLTVQLGEKPTVDELANELGITQEKVIEIIKLTGEKVDEEALRGPVKKGDLPHRSHHGIG